MLSPLIGSGRATRGKWTERTLLGKSLTFFNQCTSRLTETVKLPRRVKPLP